MTDTAVTPVEPIDELAANYAERITTALPLTWARRVSMHDTQGNVCWQSEDLWGPAEREAVRLAMEQFVGHSAPGRCDHDLPHQRTAILLRAADSANVFRGFVMVVVESRRLRGKGKSIHDLPVPVQRAANEWAVKLATRASAAQPTSEVKHELAPAQTDRLLSFGPKVHEPVADEVFARLRAFPVALVAQNLTPLQEGLRIHRYEVYLREAAANLADTAPLRLLREADAQGLGTVLDRRVAGALIVWLSKRLERFADYPAQFSVNLSGSSLSDPNFMQFISLCLAKARLPAHLIAFEVNQSSWNAQRGCLERLGQAVAGIGAGLVIDNCSLSDDTPALLSLHGVKLIKIDRLLTRDLGQNKVAQMRIAGLTHMARFAAVHTVAKNVESGEEREILTSLGVDFVQGRAVAAPVPLDELDRLHDKRVVVDDEELRRQDDFQQAS